MSKLRSLVVGHLLLPKITLLKKTNRGWELVTLSFSAVFNGIISEIILTDQMSLFECLYFLRYLSICAFACAIISFLVSAVMNFEIYLSFSYQAAFLHDQKSQAKV